MLPVNLFWDMNFKEFSLQAGSGGAGSGTIFGRPHLPLKPRLKRVNLKDLLFLLEQEKETSKTNLLYKAYLK